MIDFVSSKKFILPVVYVIIGVIVYNLIAKYRLTLQVKGERQ